MPTTYKFNCKKCKMNFSVDAESKNTNDLNKEFKRGVRCPKCDDKWGEKGSQIMIELEIPVSRSQTKSLEQRRKENAEASIHANRQAAEFARLNPQKNVTIERPKGMQTSKYANQTEQVPEDVIKSLEDKFPG